MRIQFVTTGLAVATAMVLLGAGCSPTGSNYDATTPVPEAPSTNQGSNSDPYQNGDPNPGDAPVTDYEKDLSSPSQQ